MEERLKTTIIYEDRHILVCCKPSGLAVQTARVGQQDMVGELKNYLKSPYLGIVHRLDQPVEGLLVFGKTREAAESLSGQLTGGTLNKEYYAVVTGTTVLGNGILVDDLVKDAASGAARIVTGHKPLPSGAKKAVLQYRVAECVPCAVGQVQNVLLSLLTVHIDTGRFHQIRVQLAGAGSPILGDQKYGNSLSRNVSGELGIRYPALCAYHLEFRHPVDGRHMRFEIEPQGEAYAFFHILTPGSGQLCASPSGREEEK